MNLLKKAKSSRRFQYENIEDLTKFIADLGLEGTFKEEHFNPNVDSLAEWFTNAPTWLRRS